MQHQVNVYCLILTRAQRTNDFMREIFSGSSTNSHTGSTSSHTSSTTTDDNIDEKHESHGKRQIQHTESVSSTDRLSQTSTEHSKSDQIDRSRWQPDASSSRLSQPNMIVNKMKTLDDHDRNSSLFESNNSDYTHETVTGNEHAKRHPTADEHDLRDYTDFDYVQQLRSNTYSPGTRFHVTHNFTAVETNDLTIHKDEIVILVEQQTSDWWLFKNLHTDQQGLVPINCVRALSIENKFNSLPSMTSSSILCDAWKNAQWIPSGCTPSELAPLSKLTPYQLFHTLHPTMMPSNLSFADLHWRYDRQQIASSSVKYQKILLVDRCIQMPIVNYDQVIDLINISVCHECRLKFRLMYSIVVYAFACTMMRESFQIFIQVEHMLNKNRKTDKQRKIGFSTRKMTRNSMTNKINF
jgi:hypothetical protein